MTVNLKILAKQLNLSIATVSRAMKDSHEVSLETKQRVWDLAEKLNYQPNPYASSLRGQKSHTIAVVIPEIANNFFSLAINGIEEVAQVNDYHVLIYLTHDNFEKEKSISRHLQSGRVDGILMSVSSESNCGDHLRELNRKIPMVFFDRVCEEIDTPKVITDDFESGYEATKHLIENGCKRIAFLQISDSLSIGKKRKAGYTHALEEFKIKIDEKIILSRSENESENYGAIKKLVTKKNPPDGIFASTENLAITTYEVCKELGISIPEKLKVIGFSNLPTAPLLKPSLSTITQPAFEIGKQATLMLFDLLKKKSFRNRNLVLKSSLIDRDSTKR